MTSIRTKLLSMLLIGILFGASIAAISVYSLVKEEVSETFDYQLKEMAASFLSTDATLLKTLDKHEKIEEENDFVLLAYNTDGKEIYSSGIHLNIPKPSKFGYENIYVNSQWWRSYSVKSNEEIVIALQSIDGRNELAEKVAIKTVIPILLLLLPFGIFTWFVVKRSLLPLRNLQNAIEKRSENSLEPLEVKSLPLELKPLAVSLNDLLERLKQSFLYQKAFIADAAHELRTPLTALKLQLELAEKSKDKQELDCAHKNLSLGIERANRLISQLLTLARKEGGFADASIKPINVANIIKSVVIAFMRIAELKNIDIGITQLDDAEVFADENDIEIILSNLIDNAIKYTPQDGKIDIALYLHSDKVVICVSDTGNGIPNQLKERIFDRFYRIENNTVIGSGLGLAIVKKICNIYGASIIIDDNKPRGTIFNVVFNKYSPKNIFKGVN